MARSETAFSWKDGRVPACRVHSRIKLDILRSYLLQYFPTVAANPRIDAVKIHLVDAFSGGGIFRDPLSDEQILGSPLVMLQAVKTAETCIDESKTKPFKINAKFHFADKSKAATDRLLLTLKETGFESKYTSGEVAIDRAPFDKYLPKLLQRIPTNQKTKAIFFLDQTGWNHATLNHCNSILEHLPKAEIIWNISIESLAMFANDNSDFRSAISRFGVDLGDAFTSLPSFSHYSNWRKALVATFLQQIRQRCRARYVSPFMIQHEGWGFWLLHLSNHHQANDVMKKTHWSHQNSSLHEGFPGLRMLEFDRDNWNQSLICRFDEDARNATHRALVNELGPRIRELGDMPTVATLMASIANETPADRKKVYEALAELQANGEFSIVGPKNENRRATPQTLEDRLVVPVERQIWFPGM